ncbi:MAG: hypothetical protein NE330_02800 [Lentisphaeraceae bacterium]|nr:hypothetical protein [Lentisphaeraceae bacterium]
MQGTQEEIVNIEVTQQELEILRTALGHALINNEVTNLGKKLDSYSKMPLDFGGAPLLDLDAVKIVIE